MEGRELAELLQQALLGALPDEFGVIVVENGLGLLFRGHLQQTTHFDDDEGPLCERVGQIISALSSIQDGVIMETHESWPTMMNATRSAIALPGASCDGAVLHMWFGDRHSPALLLRPVRLPLKDGR